MELSKETIELINKQAKDYLIGWANGDEASAYRTGAQAWAVWKQKAEGLEKALKEITERSVCYNAIAIAKNALESFNQNKVK